MTKQYTVTVNGTAYEVTVAINFSSSTTKTFFAICSASTNFTVIL